MWHDFRLTWRPRDYDVIQTITVDSNDVWTPQIILRNS